ncbi:GtrA family protein [Rhodobacter sp. CZR27]|uniref:GtrA family protein n=1 Tax=Rhodobacter sp. CZR27 TaxID=2033869 RepID=UPI000BBE8D53|nr:GtrA family protein [Rhodobacter sp. CZR27]
MRRRVPTDLLRFGVVSVLGLGLDLAVAWGLAVLAGLALPFAAVCGFVAGAALNYVLHHFWTFRSAAPRAAGDGHARRLLRYGAGLGLTLASRVATVAVLERVLFPSEGEELAALAGGTAVSFVVNYLSSRHFVFRPGAAPEIK